jgi:hypothetical protein
MKNALRVRGYGGSRKQKRTQFRARHNKIKPYISVLLTLGGPVKRLADRGPRQAASSRICEIREKLQARAHDVPSIGVKARIQI